MTTNLQNSPYLPRQRNFPNDSSQALGTVLDKVYIEIASRVNERTIGLFSVNLPSITGEQWFLQGQPKKRQTLRQVYEFNGPLSPSVTIEHGINLSDITGFTKIYGTFVDLLTVNNPFWYPLPWVSVVDVTNQINIFINGSNIVITGGGGPLMPIVDHGFVVLEWLTFTDTNS